MVKIAIRTSNAPYSGKGHIHRCLQIRRHIKKKVVWFLDNKDINFEKKVFKRDKIIYEKSSKSINKLSDLIQRENIKLVLLDSYHITEKELFKKINKKVSLVSIQDKEIKQYADLTIIPQPIKILKKKITIKSGPKYIPIAKEYVSKSIISKSKNIILISMGAFDKAGITLNIIDALISYDFLDGKYKIIIALGEKSPNINKVKKKIINYKNFSLLINKKNMNAIYKKTFFAIGAPGLSHAERLAAGVPSILISQNILHNKIINEWVDMRCAIKSNKTKNSIQDNINLIISNQELRNKIIKNGKEKIDGKGAERIAKEIGKIKL